MWTAIGTKFVPTYANLFIAGLEKRIFQNSGYHPYLWLRFLDDIFCIWTDGLEKLQEFFKFLNAFHPTIKFTMDYSYETINFLDVQVSKRNSTLETDLYCKDADRNQYVHAKSCHRYVYKKYILFGQPIRLRRIISDDIVLDEHLKELETWFTNRGYNSEKVKQEIERVKTMDRAGLLNKRKKEIDNRIPLILTYHPPALTKVYEILQKAHGHRLKYPLAFRNAKTLKDHLVRSKLRTTYEKPGVTICGKKNCEICHILHQGETFES